MNFGTVGADGTRVPFITLPVTALHADTQELSLRDHVPSSRHASTREQPHGAQTSPHDKQSRTCVPPTGRRLHAQTRMKRAHAEKNTSDQTTSVRNAPS